jgi:hypothetical protein
MTAHQQQIAEFLLGLKRPAEAISVNSGIPVEVVKARLTSGRWPAINRQRQLFDAGATTPRETTQPASTLGGNRGLSLFSRDPVGKPVLSNHSGMEVFE